MAPEVHRPTPPYLQIVGHYKTKIQNGELQNGDRLPSTRQLVEEWGVAHATAARALSTLRAEGLVTTTPGGGGGTVVDVREANYSPRDRMQAVRRWGRIYPPDEHARIFAAELTSAPDHVAEAMGIPPGSQVIRRHRVTYRGDTPVSTSTSWLDGSLAAVAPDLLKTERIRQGTPGYIEQRTGRVLRRGLDQVAAGAATPDVAESLGLATGDPVLVGRNWVRDEDGDVVEFGENFSAGGRWRTYEYELR